MACVREILIIIHVYYNVRIHLVLQQYTCNYCHTSKVVMATDHTHHPGDGGRPLACTAEGRGWAILIWALSLSPPQYMTVYSPPILTWSSSSAPTTHSCQLLTHSLEPSIFPRMIISILHITHCTSIQVMMLHVCVCVCVLYCTIHSSSYMHACMQSMCAYRHTGTITCMI